MTSVAEVVRMPHIPEISEVKRTWVQTNDGSYVSPTLGGFGADAGCWPRLENELLGFRLVWYEKGEAERILRA